MRLISW